MQINLYFLSVLYYYIAILYFIWLDAFQSRRAGECICDEKYNIEHARVVIGGGAEMRVVNFH